MILCITLCGLHLTFSPTILCLFYVLTPTIDQLLGMSTGLYLTNIGVYTSFLFLYLKCINSDWSIRLTVERLMFEEFFNHPYLSDRQLAESFR